MGKMRIILLAAATLAIFSSEYASANIFGTSPTDKPKRAIPEQCKASEKKLLGNVDRIRTTSYNEIAGNAGVQLCGNDGSNCQTVFGASSDHCEKIKTEVNEDTKLDQLCADDRVVCENSKWVKNDSSPRYPTCNSTQEISKTSVFEKLSIDELKKARCEKLAECIPNLEGRDIRLAQQWENEFDCGK
jgi:hypothetical protein